MAARRHANHGDTDVVQKAVELEPTYAFHGDHAHGSNADLAEEMAGYESPVAMGWLDNLLTGGRGPAIDTEVPVLSERNQQPSVPYTLEAPVWARNFAFNGGNADAHEYVITFEDGVTFSIYAPAEIDPTMNQHTVAEAALAASHLPLAQRSRVTSIVLNPTECDKDVVWRRTLDPNHHSYMTAGAAGVITVYPDDENATPSIEGMQSAMVHEVGHTWSYQQWGEDTERGPGWLRWRNAMASDGRSLSTYASRNIVEDVAETVRAYVCTEGTERQTAYREIVPYRFAILDAELA